MINKLFKFTYFVHLCQLIFFVKDNIFLTNTYYNFFEKNIIFKRKER